MKTLDSIPTSKLERASKLVKTGVKIGGNYLKYYGESLVGSDEAKDRLNENNASDIYDGLKTLKGSALKVAQMLSMERNILPRAYVDRFSLSQFSVPPLSGPLVKKTFRRYMNASPEDIFDSFDHNAINAASIGQVHKANKEGKNLAVKIQYPGVAESISSDLALVKPIALRMFNMGARESEKYFKEIEEKLKEETDYLHELDMSVSITSKASHIPNLRFPNYYPEYSSERILTMDWMDGVPLGVFVNGEFDADVAQALGQSLWDFYMFQIHGLKAVHADPHPGNFLVNQQGELIVIDFGCIKEIPNQFYTPYFELANASAMEDQDLFLSKLYELEMLVESDGADEITYFTKLFREMLQLFTAPFNRDRFDFANPEFWDGIGKMAEFFSQDQTIRKMNANRGSKHFLYMNRTFFGLYNLLYDLKADVDTKAYLKYLPN
jgi:predicted unusual protein kinase regulating ubiquinone biosynthesis (AarF/ABC1/UbiB family)